MKIQVRYKENYGNKHFYPICLYSHKLLKFKDTRKKCFTLDEIQYLKEKLFFEVNIKIDTGV